MSKAALPQHIAPSASSRSEPTTILGGINERLDHLGVREVAIELIKLIQPEIITCVIRIRSVVRVAAQVTDELHQYEGAVELSIDEIGMFGNLPQHLGAILLSGRMLYFQLRQLSCR